jgi:transcriptional regulator with XRE-family HTH domain
VLQGHHDGRVACCRWPAPPPGYGVITEDDRDIDDPATSFGELLSCLRLATGVSQNALGREAGVNASYINRLERGERTTPTREVVLALARALQTMPQERDHLLVTAGYVPPSLQQLGPADSTLEAVGRLLVDGRLPPASLAAFRAVVETIAACWGSRCDARPACVAVTDDRVGGEGNGSAIYRPRPANALRGPGQGN